MITYHQHYHNYLEICRCYKAIYESEGVQDDPAVWGPVSNPLFSATECGRMRSAGLLQLDWSSFPAGCCAEVCLSVAWWMLGPVAEVLCC